MSVQDISFAKVFRVLAFGLIVWAIGWAALWFGNVDAVPAMKIAGSVAIGWVTGNMSETGLVVPTFEGLKK